MIYEDLEHLSPYMHTADDVVGTSLNSPVLFEANTRLAAAGVAALAGPLLDADGTLYLRGDADVSGSVDITDAVAILLYLFLGRSAEDLCLNNADLDHLGSVEIADAIYLLEFLFQGGDSPSPPWPECGPDDPPPGLQCLPSGCRIAAAL